MPSSKEVKEILVSVLPNVSDIDESTLDYFESIISDATSSSDSSLTISTNIKESLCPFLESYGIITDLDAAEVFDIRHKIYNHSIINELRTIKELCDAICKRLQLADNSSGSSKPHNSSYSDAPQLLNKVVQLSEVAKNQVSEDEQATIDDLWGFAAVRKKRNEVLEVTEAGSAKYERKAMKEQKKWLDDLEVKFVGGEEESNEISTMTLPDLSGNNREKDIIVTNFNVTYGGHILLEGADLRIVYGRRYGLIGRNGIGKTTLLKHMARFDIEGFPKHHRVLHVKQEVRASEQSVLSVVLSADVERTMLLSREKQLSERQHSMTGLDAKEMQQLMNEMAELHERMNLIGVDSAESRAASILAGLQFSESMQAATTASLSGGWRMRVALAGALFIQPDLLMLDEPTNHLDLEAVLWLEEYLKGYPNTILLVSHDRAFLNEVCTDIVLFKDLKLTYFRGNFDSYEATRKEMQIVQQKQHESQQVKLQHMQEFVDKFRYNAKRASLVQSRIKAIERETVVEAVEEEEAFSFSFSDAGPLGRPVVQIEGVTFGYDKANPLFCNVHLGIDQSSRVALVGPNGAGKSTLFNLLQGKLPVAEGYIRINPNLRLGVFTQHHLDSFDLTKSPLQNMMGRWPLANEAELRSHLGRYEITGSDALKPMQFSSGGQKSRAAFACLTYTKPHLVVLDEPTNHLDMSTIEALIDALKRFSGGVLVISHDQHFITNVCSEIWVIRDKKIEPFNGGFHDYKKKILSSSSSGSRKR